MNFGEFRTWFDEQFSFLLEKKIRDFITHGKNSDITPIVSYITSIAKNGKRFHPFLVYSASNLNKKNANDHFLLFASVELLHIFALIHDDIMDEADMRHGVICAHKKFTAKYGKTTSQSIGILLGDLVFAWAYECLFEYTSLFPNTHHRITQEFTQLVSEVTYGQILDVLSPSQKPLEEKAILEKMILKTARYSFVRPLLLGFVLSGDQTTDHEFAEKFGLALGIGFQLQDDLLDTLPTEKTGKSQFSDIQNKNQTLLSHYLFQSKPEYSNKLMLFWGKTLVDENDRQSLTHILVNSGAIDYIKKLTTEYFNKAQTTVTERDDSDQPRWKSIIELIENRKK